MKLEIWNSNEPMTCHSCHDSMTFFASSFKALGTGPVWWFLFVNQSHMFAIVSSGPDTDTESAVHFSRQHSQMHHQNTQTQMTSLIHSHPSIRSSFHFFMTFPESWSMSMLKNGGRPWRVGKELVPYRTPQRQPINSSTQAITIIKVEYLKYWWLMILIYDIMIYW